MGVIAPIYIFANFVEFKDTAERRKLRMYTCFGLRTADVNVLTQDERSFNFVHSMLAGALGSAQDGEPQGSALLASTRRLARPPGGHLFGGRLPRGRLPGGRLPGGCLSRGRLSGRSLSKGRLPECCLPGGCLLGAGLLRSRLPGAGLAGLYPQRRLSCVL